MRMERSTLSHVFPRCLAVISATTLLVLLVMACDLEQARAETFSLSIIVQLGDVIDGKVVDGIDSSSPSFNDNGDVAFVGSLGDSTGSKGGIATQNAILFETGDIVVDGGIVTQGPGANRNWLNNNGEVVFLGAFPTGAGIFTQDALLARTGQTIGGVTLNTLKTPVINDNGDVMFVGGTGLSGIFTPSSLLVEVGQTIDGETLTSLVELISLNNNGDVAFRGSFAQNGGDSAAIFTQNSLLVRDGQTIDGKTLTNVGVPALNNNGDLVFTAMFSGGVGVFTLDALLVETGDILGGVTLNAIDIVNLNDNGDFVFRGGHGNIPGQNENGIFTQNALVAQVGQTIGGHTLTALSNFPSINNSGDVVFLGTFDDGQRRIILAQPNGVMPVAIDINPNKFPNRISLKKNTIQVAILTTVILMPPLWTQILFSLVRPALRLVQPGLS